MAANRLRFRGAARPRQVGYYGPQIAGPAGCDSDGADLTITEDECGVWTRSFMGVAADAVAAGASIAIPVKVKVPFRGEVVKVSSRIADSFELLSFNVGKNGALPTTTFPIDCVTISEVSQGACVKLPTISPNNDGEVTVRNHTQDPADFRMTIFGWMQDT